MGLASVPEEDPMEKQMVLPLDEQGQEQRRRLWKQIPEESRAELVVRYARLIAQAVRAPVNSRQQEPRHEANDR